MRLFDRPKAAIDAVTTAPREISDAIGALTFAVIFLGIAILIASEK